MTDIWLVVACPQARADDLTACLTTLDHPEDRTVIVTAVHHDPILEAAGHIIYDVEHDFSLARLWNNGLRRAYNSGATEVAVFASDVRGHPDSLASLASCLRGNKLSMAGPAWHTGSLVLHGDRTTELRVPGGCWMVAAEHRLFCDESYRWWYTDDSLEMSARQVGPVGVFTGTGLVLSQPDSGLDTPEKRRWAEEDRAYFVEQWGCEPW